MPALAFGMTTAELMTEYQRAIDAAARATEEQIKKAGSARDFAEASMTLRAAQERCDELRTAVLARSVKRVDAAETLPEILTACPDVDGRLQCECDGRLRGQSDLPLTGDG